MNRETLSQILLMAALLLVALAGATVLPGQTKVLSDLGYHAFCPFAPYSTISLLLMAGLAWIVRGYVDRLPS